MTPDQAKIEPRTLEIGRAIFARVKDAESRSIGHWWQRQVMGRGMRDEQVKAQLFRFVDVLPALSSAGGVTRHLREYLAPVNHRLPILAAPVVNFLPRDGWMGRGVAGAARLGARAMARRFIAAGDLPEAIAAVSRLRKRSLGFTLDLLGEAVLSEAEAARYQQSYLRLIDGLADAAAKWPAVDLLDRDDAGATLPRVNVSIKLSSLFSQFDPLDPDGASAAVRARLGPILALARRRGVFVNIDMEQYAYKDLTIRIFRDILDEPEFHDWTDVGIAIQAYLKDSGEDLANLAAWSQRRGTPVWVRLVKGAYWDFETISAAQNDWPVPVFAHKSETDANFEEQTAFLIGHHHLLRPAIASHNIRSIARALALAEAHGLGPRAVEFQMLFGMADSMKDALVAMGQRVRVYTPFGDLLPGMAYLVRRLLENTSNESFLRAGFLEHVPEEQLLMNPANISPPPSPSLRQSASHHPAAATFHNEPMTDFSRVANRQAMREALAGVANLLGQSYPLIINGQAKMNDATIESFDPSHRWLRVGRAAAANVDDANAAVAAAKNALPAWRDLGAEKRSDLLLECAKIMRRRRFELAAWEVAETGKPWREADADVAEGIDFCVYYAHEMRRLAAPRHHDVPGEENQTFYEPRGVTVVIAPWNFPLAILCGMTTAALAAGNTVIMKPAEQSPIIAAKLMEIFVEARLPQGAVNYLPGVGEEIGPALVNHPDVAVIAFTGSRSVGLTIAAEAARTPAGQNHVKRVITEMGGKNAIIVDDDADLDEAVHGVVASAFGYAGQKCSACSRAIVLESVYDQFLDRLIEATRSLKIGPAEDPSVALGPVIDETARQRILTMIEKAKTESRLAYAAEIGPLAEEGFYVGPHIFADVPPSATIAREEIFGPVLAVIKATTLDVALDIANGTDYALTGGIYSRSPANIDRARLEFRVGNLYINRKITGALVDRQPFGGFKLSGGGTKAGGSDYLLNFLLPRTITENTLRHGFAPAGE
jgi:RHH-type proline utilization regulon transcriptional repressor/proline dehydrogenase/delta 1-pyrroline-5-carboxylate dehydrogenase